jgi:uncharacterized membrane protein YbhN (UPF0104 family)
MKQAEATKKGRLVRKILGALLAISISTVLIGSAFFRPSFEGGVRLVPRFPFEAWLRDLPSNLWWVGLFALFSASMAPLRGWRWGFTLPRPKPPYADRYHAVAIGLLGNNVIPGKLGEGLRALAMTRFSRDRGRELPFAQTLGTILVCKLLDLVALLILVAASPNGPFFGTNVFGGGFVGAAIAIPALTFGLLAVGRWAPRLADTLQRNDRAPRLQLLLRELALGVAASGSPKRLALALLATLVAISSVAMGYTTALWGVGVDVDPFAGVILLAAVTLGQSPPGVPAGLGMYYLSSSWAARLLGATGEQAATIAVLTHLTTVLSHLGVGAASVVIRRIRLRDFLPRRGESRLPA